MIEIATNNTPTDDEITVRLLRLYNQIPKSEMIDLINELEEKYHKNKRSTRIPYCAEVIFCVNEKFYTGYTVNINTNGIFIETENRFSFGDKLTLSFQAPGSGEHVKITGKITWVAKNGVGVSFDVDIEQHLKGTQLQALDSIMQQNTLLRNTLKAG